MITINHPELWQLDSYNLICFGPGSPHDEEIFQMSSGRASFESARVFEYTSPALKRRYASNIAGLAQLPSLVVAECSLNTSHSEDAAVPARFSRLANVRQEGGDVAFDYRHLSSLLTSQEVFTLISPVPQRSGVTENLRTHWAVKEGNLIEKLSALWDKRASSEKPKFFGLDEWPLVKRDHIAVMMSYSREFDPVYETIKQACAEVNYPARRVDEIYGPNLIIKDVFTTIDTSKLVICDITGKNPNVLYEAGIAHTRNVDVILLTQKSDDVPFNLAQVRYIQYFPNAEGLQTLKADLVKTIEAALSAG